MRDEWRDTVALAQARRLGRERELVSDFSGRLQHMRDEQAGLLKRGLWYHGRADVLGILGHGRREVYHCLMLAWLLDPGTPHGLDVAFLRSFLSEVDPKLEHLLEGDLLRMNVATEVVGPNSRTDLVIHGQAVTVAVEVKVDASEQKDQCHRMYLNFQDQPDPRFVFLTPRGRRPTTHCDLPIEQFKCLSFTRIRDLLSEVIEQRRDQLLKALEASPGRKDDPFSGGAAACLNYLHTLRQEFP